MYRQAYYEVLDLAVGELQKRFKQSDLELVNELESLLVTAANGTVEIGERSAKYLQQRVDIDWLNIQLAMLPDGIRSALGNRLPHHR